jgi:hypothetical protein
MGERVVALNRMDSLEIEFGLPWRQINEWRS